jgi:hypothetical protein
MTTQILHFLFVIVIIFFMLLMLIPAIMIYMFTGVNLIQEIQIEASKLERKFFDK